MGGLSPRVAQETNTVICHLRLVQLEVCTVLNFKGKLMIDVKKVALLARLEITDEEEALYKKQIPSILQYFEKISVLDTSGVEPLVTPTPMVQTLRIDEVAPGLGAEKAMANAPEKSGNLYKVPPVV